MSTAARLDTPFVTPNWDAEADPHQYLSAVPDHATVKGMFMGRIVEFAEQRGADFGKFGPYRAFRDYPLREMMELEIQVARGVYPDLTLRDGIRRLGWLAYPTLLESMVGRVVFGVLGSNLKSIYKITSKGYSISTQVGNAEVLEVSDNHGLVRLTDMYNFADAYQVGVFEGVLLHYRRRGEVLIRPTDPFNIDVLVRWT